MIRVITGVIDWTLSAKTAIDLPRFFHPMNTSQDKLEFEANIGKDSSVINGLKQKGHVIGWLREGFPMQSLVQAIKVNADLTLEAVTDPRIKKIGIGK